MSAYGARCAPVLQAPTERVVPQGRQYRTGEAILSHRSRGMRRGTVCAARGTGGGTPADGDRVLAAAVRDPVSFLGGMFAGFLALDLNQGK